MAGPLEGVRVVDLTRVMSGPFSTAMLADLGADVVKVEARGAGDVFRHMGGYQRGGINAIFMGFNRGKRSITLDLHRREGQEIARKLCSTADVMIENFRPGVAAHLGLGADVLHADNPGLIIASISGFGAEGPSADEPAYDPILQGRAGIAARQKASAGAPPDAVRSFISDKVGGLFATQSVLAALLAREKGARGQTIDLSLLDASMYYAFADGLQEIAFVGDGVSPGAIFAYQPLIHQTADGFVIYAAVSMEDRRRLAKAMGREDLNEDPRFATLVEAMKPENYNQFLAEIDGVLSSVRTEDAIERLLAAGVPVSRVAEPKDLLNDPHVTQTGFLAEVEHPTAGRVRQPSYPAKFSGTATGPTRPAPVLGQHTVEILREMGYQDEQISTLTDTEII